MKTEKIVKSTVADVAKKIRNGVDVAEENVDASVDAFSATLASFEKQLGAIAERLLASAKEISGVADKKARTHPLAAFGIAFVAGIAIARVLRK